MGELDRLRWQCRRGLLELDLVLATFLREGAERLTPAERADLMRLLEAPDNDLWAWISGRDDPADAAFQPLIERLRVVRPGA